MRGALETKAAVVSADANSVVPEIAAKTAAPTRAPWLHWAEQSALKRLATTTAVAKSEGLDVAAKPRRALPRRARAR